MKIEVLKEKIKKPLALSESSNENEAAKAIQMAMKLCASGGLEIDDLKKEKISDEIHEASVSEQQVKIEHWVKALCNRLSKLFACVAMVEVEKKAHDSKPVERLIIYGYPQDVAIFEYLYIYIKRQINVILGQKIPREGYLGAHEYRLRRESFALGVVKRVIERAEELFKRDASSSAGYALVLSRRDKVMNYLTQDRALSTKRSRPVNLNEGLIEEGYKEGNGIALNRVMTESERNHRMIHS